MRYPLILLLLIFSFESSKAQDCLNSTYEVNPTLLNKAFDKVANQQLDYAGRAALLKLYKSKYSFDKNFVNQSLKKLNDIVKVLEATEAIAAGDYKKVAQMGVMTGIESGLASAGVPLLGPIIATIEVTAFSYQELRHQNCLQNIDLGYYRFLDDPKLINLNGKAQVDYYINNYIKGEGLDPMGNDRDQNRQYLQCFIDEELPADQRVQIDYDDRNPFDRISQATAFSHPAVRTGTLIMLKDFGNRKKLEYQKKEARRIVQSADYSLLKEVLPALGSYPLLTNWLCQAYEEEVKIEKEGKTGKPDLSCPWNSKFGKIYWQDGYYGNTSKTITGSLVNENGKWVYVGKWGRSNKKEWGGAVRFEFKTSTKFDGYYISGGSSELPWDGTGSCGDSK